ncbi:MAG TPA: hypothetical protein VF723_17095 [Pyrinomonadaceae bacterium]|jgi:hypothetical protein
MGKLKENFLRLIYGSDEKLFAEGQRLVTENLRRMIGRCPVCDGELTGHSYAGFAVTVLAAENEQRVAALLAVLREHRWDEALGFREFEPLGDALVAQALRCAGRRIAWQAVREPYELGETQTLLEQEILDYQDSRRLASLIGPESWVSLEK